jgi:hypothetical protein
MRNSAALGSIARHRSVIITLVLVTLGLVFIVASQTFHWVWLKVEVDRLVAEIGALLLVVCVLHWLFEFGLREEMLREVAGTVAGNTLLHDSGLETCSMDSRQVEDRVHWSRSANLTIGRQYSPRFLKDFCDVLRERCKQGLPTIVTVLRADGIAARYLQESRTGNPTVKVFAEEITNLLGEIDTGAKRCTRLLFHDRVLRYSFIQTDECVWITFFTNSPDRATVPAFKIRAGTPLFKFFADDIKRLLEQSSEAPLPSQTS